MFLEDLERFGGGFVWIWKDLKVSILWICTVFLRFWKGCGRASGGLEGFSLNLEGSGSGRIWNLDLFLAIWKNLERFGKVSWDLERFPCLWKGLEGLLVHAGMGNLLEKGAVISLLKDYWLPCHRVDRM